MEFVGSKIALPESETAISAQLALKRERQSGSKQLRKAYHRNSALKSAFCGRIADGGGDVGIEFETYALTYHDEFL